MNKLSTDDTLRLSERQREAVRELVAHWIEKQRTGGLCYQDAEGNNIYPIIKTTEQIKALEEKLGMNDENDLLET
mgnify:CR=1 FL=1|tara:strand:+ start:261 stop:485 length:225 start_codon:yes stop_codon:yes gene_type:complete